MANPPVILLAFANDREGRFLRSIAEEQRRIRKALGPLVDRNLIQLEELPNATADDIFDAFRRLKDRVSVFHYGGHAGDLELILNSGRLHIEGFARYLAEQKGLQLACMNGCATQAQQEVLVDAGIPAMILTNSSIADETALQFSQQFYENLASGRTIQRSFAEASAALVSERPTYAIDELYRGDVDRETISHDGLPWELFQVAEHDWVLPTKVPFPWLRFGFVLTGLILLFLSIVSVWQFVLSFDIDIPIDYPDGMNSIHFTGSFAEAHILLLDLPKRNLTAMLQEDGYVEFERVNGQTNRVPIQLSSPFWMLVDSAISLNRDPKPLVLDWKSTLKHIKGRIQDKSGPVSGVSVQLKDETVNKRVRTKSNQEGYFQLDLPIELVPNFKHELILEKDGYRKTTQLVNLADGTLMYTLFLMK